MLLTIVLVLLKLVGAIEIFLSVKLYLCFTASHDLYFPFISTKLPKKLIPLFKNQNKIYTIILNFDMLVKP